MKKLLNRLGLSPRAAARGDTIVEVIISMTVLALIIATAFILSGHSLQTATDTGNRQASLALAQQQVEMLKQAGFNDTAGQLKQYQISQPFCIYTSGPNAGQPDTQDVDSQGFCNGANNTPLGVKINYSNKSHVFTVTRQWAATDNNVPDQLTLYYKLPTPNGNSGSSGPPSITFTANPASITAGNSSTLQWTATNATSCSATSPAGWTSSTSTSGSQSVSPGSTTTYQLSCTGPGGSKPASATVTVTTSSSSTPSVKINSVSWDSASGYITIKGQVNPNGTANTNPYISIGNTCNSGANADNPSSRYNSLFTDSPAGPFSDNTWHNEQSYRTFSFYFCGYNDPYKVQQCAWWGTNISNWQPNHVCSSIYNIYSSGSGGGTSSNGSNGGSSPSCSVYSISHGNNLASINGACSNSGSPIYYKMSVDYKDRYGDDCGTQNIGPQTNATFSLYANWAYYGVTGYTIGWNSSYAYPPGVASSGYFTSWTQASSITCG